MGIVDLHWTGFLPAAGGHTVAARNQKTIYPKRLPQRLRGRKWHRHNRLFDSVSRADDTWQRDVGPGRCLFAMRVHDVIS
jgi:hypothetical protein